MGKSKEQGNHNRKPKRTSPTRLIDLTDEAKIDLLAAARKRAQEVASRPTPEPKKKVPAIIRGLAMKLRQEDETLSAEAIAAGIVDALGPDILGGDFIAPAPATIARHVRTALSATQDQKGATAGSS